uniref:thiamine pyrophosphate-dependent dehydrogenase E1 component subunit alpha n=1 Tax=Rheinheimera sp. TaxID=1869214 RepID=UPI00404864CC
MGQEAGAVGVCEHLKPSDWVFINYRGHAFYLAKGGPLPAFFAELMGRRTGLSKGKAGSMHLAAPAQGVIGASAVVASTISHAVGSALAAKIKKESGRVFVANFGDGAMEQGVFHESLNFASLHKVPVLFLCEDNGLAVHTDATTRQSFNVEALVGAFGLPFLHVDEGYDPELVANAASVAVNHVRTNQSPFFLRVKTCRYREHVGPGEDFFGGYRSEADLAEWKSRDPLITRADELSGYESEIRAEIDAAVAYAMNSPFPTEEDLLTDVL